MSSLVSFPREIYEHGFFPYLAARDIHSFSVVSPAANSIVQEVAGQPFEHISGEKFEFTKPVSISVFLRMKEEMDNIPLLQKLNLRTLALVSQGTTLDPLNDAERVAFLSNVDQIVETVFKKESENLEERKLMQNRWGSAPILSDTDKLRYKSLELDIQEANSLGKTLGDLEHRFKTWTFTIKCFNPSFQGETQRLPPNAVAKLRDLKIASANVLGIRIESIKGLTISGKTYGDAHDNTSILVIPRLFEVATIFVLTKNK